VLTNQIQQKLSRSTKNGWDGEPNGNVQQLKFFFSQKVYHGGVAFTKYNHKTPNKNCQITITGKYDKLHIMTNHHTKHKSFRINELRVVAFTEYKDIKIA
jgi:phenolic acid decarboxylase